MNELELRNKLPELRKINLYWANWIETHLNYNDFRTANAIYKSTFKED